MQRAAVITHGKPQTIGPALERLEKVAREAGVELLLPDEEVEKHGVGWRLMKEMGLRVRALETEGAPAR